MITLVKNGNARNVYMPSTTWHRLLLLLHDRQKATRKMLTWMGLPAVHNPKQSVRVVGEVLDWILRSDKHRNTLRRAYALALDRGVSSDFFDAKRVRREAKGRSRILFASSHDVFTPSFDVDPAPMRGGGKDSVHRCKGQSVPEHGLLPRDLGIVDSVCGAQIAAEHLLCEQCSRNVNPLNTCFLRTIAAGRSLPTLSDIRGASDHVRKRRMAAAWSAGPDRGAVDWKWVQQIAAENNDLNM